MREVGAGDSEPGGRYTLNSLLLSQEQEVVGWCFLSGSDAAGWSDDSRVCQYPAGTNIRMGANCDVSDY